jgi:hypothetical protein
MVHLNRHNFLGTTMNNRTRVIEVVRTTEDMYNARLAVVNAGHKDGVEDLHGIYCLAVAIADYIAIIEEGDPLAKLSEDELMKTLVFAKFIDDNGKLLNHGFRVSLHFTPLSKHFIVTSVGNGGNIVFFNRTDKTSDTEFELGTIAPQRDAHNVSTGEYEFCPSPRPDGSDNASIISILGLRPFQVETSKTKVRVPTAFRNGKFEMKEKQSERQVCKAKEIDAVAMTQFLQKHRRDIGSTAKRLCDVFGMHLLLADYEVRIPNGSRGSEMNKEQFLAFLVKTLFQTESGSAVEPGKTISIHHQALKMHCLVKISMNGSNRAFYHKSERDDIERFLIACIHEEGGTYYEGFFLKEQAHDIGALNLALEHQNFDATTGRTLVPEKHPNYDKQMMNRVKFGYMP